MMMMMNLALFRHKTTLYRFNQGGSYYCKGLKWEQGELSPPPPLTLTTGCRGVRQPSETIRRQEFRGRDWDVHAQVSRPRPFIPRVDRGQDRDVHIGPDTVPEDLGDIWLHLHQVHSRNLLLLFNFTPNDMNWCADLVFGQFSSVILLTIAIGLLL